MDLPALNPFRARHRLASEGAPVGPFDRIHQEIDRLFDDFAPQFFGNGDLHAGLLGAVDVGESEGAVEIVADLPGMDRKDIDVSLRNGNLFIRGERKYETEEKHRNYYKAERTHGAFSRSIPLPCEVDENRIDAQFKNGVLKVVLPKSPAAIESERKIEIKAA